MDTILAPATPQGYAGLGILRLSGPGCVALFGRELKREALEPRIMYYGSFIDPQTGEVLDRLSYVYFAGPQSFTGEDVLELFPHGNPLLVQRILEVLLRDPHIRLAEPGEFSRRALENGKMDLLQVEALGEFIHAKNIGGLRNAQKILAGKLSHPLKHLKEQLDHLSIRLELDVDFSEEEADPDYTSWEKRIRSVQRDLETLLKTWARGKRLQTQPRVALFGKPNAGKSSLINRILESDRLIVSEQAGTTRDYVEIPVQLKKGEIVFVDTAGLGEAIDALDARAMEKTRSLLGEVDYRVLLVDGSKDVSEEDLPQDTGSVEFKNSIDLVVYTKKDKESFAVPTSTSHLCVSSHTGEGVEKLLTILEENVFTDVSLEEEPYLTSERQYQCLQTALEQIQSALGYFEGEPSVELLAFEIREVRNSLSELIGEYNPEGVLNQIFAGFCIGK
jgi:tRNA modification GTPase